MFPGGDSSLPDINTTALSAQENFKDISISI